MQAFCFEKDTEFELDGVRHVVVRVWPDRDDMTNVLKNVVQFEDIQGRIESRTMQDLLQSYSRGQLQIGKAHARELQQLLPERVKESNQLTDEEQRLIDYRHGYIKAVLAHGRWLHTVDYLKPIIDLHAMHLKDPNPPSVSSVRRWFVMFSRAEYSPMGLLPRHHRKGNRKRRIDERAMELYKKFLSDEYLTMQRKPITEVHDLLKIHVRNLNRNGESLKMPSINLLYRLKNNIGEFVRMASRFGKRKANLEYRRGRKGPATLGILDRVEIDHTPLDIVVLCDKTGLPLGRPFLTMVLDAYSRMPLGFHVGFDAPCVRAVLAALGNAIEPKAYIKEMYPAVSSDWPCYGRPMELVCDNGAEFHAHEFKSACQMLGINIHYCPSKDPSQKGRIERFLRTVNEGLCQRLQGTTFGNYIVAGDYDSAKQARIGFAGLMEALHIWLIDIYPNTVHRELRKTPLAVWKEGATREPPMLPSDIHMLKRKVMRVHTRTLSKTGITNFALTYINDELVTLRERIGRQERVTIRYDHDDLSHIYVVDPDTDKPFRVDSDSPQYTEGLSLPVHQAIRKKVRMDAMDDTDVELLLNAKQALIGVIKQSMVDTKRAARTRTARITGLSSSAPRHNKGTPKVPAVKAPFALQGDNDPFAVACTEFETH